MVQRALALSAAAFAAAALAVGMAATPTSAAAPTPVPGGANQVNALSGKVGDMLFNGVLRIQIQELRDATAADNPASMLPQADQKVMVMKVLLRNGTHADFTDLLTYTLADRDGVTFEIPSNLINGINPHILPAGAARQSGLFLVDKDFAPVKLIVRCATCGTGSNFNAIRFTVPAAAPAHWGVRNVKNRE